MPTIVRRAEDPADFVVVLANFTPVPREGYRMGVPAPGFYRELLNGDSTYYGGSNMAMLAACLPTRLLGRGSPTPSWLRSRRWP